jgi:hypothetical protein
VRLRCAQIGHSEQKGRCVITTAPIPAGTFVCEYRGDLVGYKEALRREAEYAKTKQGSYMFFFSQSSTRMWCVRVTVTVTVTVTLSLSHSLTLSLSHSLSHSHSHPSASACDGVVAQRHAHPAVANAAWTRRGRIPTLALAGC